ncbi:MAG: AI-2E family transporter [Actinobacteria bacterium]|nr:AI-2E family transporter [Actinomycetota bacterium]
MATRPECNPGRIYVPRWVQLAVLPVLLIVAWFTLGAIGQVIFIFLVAGLIALVLNPLVHALERVHINRYVGVFAVYVGLVAVLILAAALVWPPVVQQLRNLTTALPGMADQAGDTIMRLQRLSDRAGLSIDVQAQLRASLTALADRVLSFTSNVVDVGVTVVRQITYLIIIVVISIYMLLDAKRIGRFVAEHFPTHSVSDGEEYVRRAKTAVVDYVKAQVLLSAALGGSVGLAMWFLGMIGAFPSGARYALFFGVWAGLMEAIPYLGPVLAAVPPSLVAVFDSPLSALWVIITFVLIQEIEGHILVPVIMGSRFRVHPLVVIFAVLAGGEIHGITGMLIAIPLIPLVKETIVFLRPRMQLEGWCAAAGGVIDAVTREEPAESQGGGPAAAG